MVLLGWTVFVLLHLRMKGEEMIEDFKYAIRIVRHQLKDPISNLILLTTIPLGLYFLVRHFMSLYGH